MVGNRYEYIMPEDYETAEKNGITKRALEQRVHTYGWDIDKAVVEPLKVIKSFRPIWEKWEHIATKNGISKQLFYRRIKSNKWAEEKSATHPLLKGRPLSIHWTKEERETAKRNGLDANYMSIVKTRIRNGWSREEAINTPKLTRKQQAERTASGTRSYHERMKVNESEKVI